MVGLEWYPCCRLKRSFSLQHGLSFFNYHNDARSNKLKISSLIHSLSYLFNSTELRTSVSLGSE